MKTYYIVFVRPVGSSCWTSERIATTKAMAMKYADEERIRKIRFADGSLHLQSTSIVSVKLPESPESSRMSYDLTNE